MYKPESSKKKPASIFVINEKITGAPLKTVTLFTETLEDQKETFCTSAQVDGGVQVEITYGIAKGAHAETKLFIEVDGVFQDIEDTSDYLSSIFFPWHKVTPISRCRIVIALTSGFKGLSLGAQLAALIHEYFVHAVYYQHIISFIRKNKNLYGEVAFYYYYHALNLLDHKADGFLNGVNQHETHGGKKAVSKSIETTWADYSGYADFNAYVKVFVKLCEKNEDHSQRLIDAAKNDITMQQKEASASTEVTPPKASGLITLKKVQDIKTREGTMEHFLKYIALIYYKADEADEYSSIVNSTFQANRSQGFVPMLTSYQEYMNLRIGNLFGIATKEIQQIMQTVLKAPNVLAKAYKFVLPQPRDMWEAYPEYVALGGKEGNVGDCAADTLVVEKVLSGEDWTRIKAYVQYRYCSGMQFGNLVRGSTKEDDFEAYKWSAYKKILDKK